MRGKVLIAFAVSHSDRITPAYAGKVTAKLTAGQTYGITPAYAGKSKGLYLHVDVTRDHPRLCGEKQYFLSLVPSKYTQAVCFVARMKIKFRITGTSLRLRRYFN